MSPQEKKKEKKKEKRNKRQIRRNQKAKRSLIFRCCVCISTCRLDYVFVSVCSFFFDFLQLNAKLLYFLKLFHVISHQYICFGYLSILARTYSGRRCFPLGKICLRRLPPRHEIDVASVTSITGSQTT